MILRAVALSFLIVSSCYALVAHGRTWSDTTGQFKVDAELLAIHGDSIIIRTTKAKKLLAIEVKHLCEEDQKYLKSEEATAPQIADADKNHVWIVRNDIKIIGKMVGFFSRDLVIERREARVFIDGKKDTDYPELFRKVIPLVVNNFEGTDFTNLSDLQKWLAKQGQTQHKYHVEGVHLVLTSGGDLFVPLFLFGSQERDFLEPGLQKWRALQSEKLAEEQRSEQERQHAMMLQSAAQAYQMDKEFQTKATMMKLELLAVTAGVTAIWEVSLAPANNYGYPFTAAVSARDSLTAEQLALQRYPNCQVLGTRKLAGY